MLNGKLIHPQIMSSLALCGHGDKILIADGNYPLASKTQGAQTVYLGLKPGQPTVTDVLDAILSAANVEKAEVMDPADGTTPEIFGSSRPCWAGWSWTSWAATSSMTPAVSRACGWPSPQGSSGYSPTS